MKPLGGRTRPTLLTMESRVDEGSRTRLEFLHHPGRRRSSTTGCSRPAPWSAGSSGPAQSLTPGDPRPPCAAACRRPSPSRFAPRSPPPSPRQLELGLEGFGYESQTSPLNRDNVARPRATTRASAALALGWKETHGGFRAVFRGYVERTWGRARGRDDAGSCARATRSTGGARRLGVRLGKQRIAWGSGLAWNPTNRLEPPKNALNTTLEQEGALAARARLGSRRRGLSVVAGGGAPPTRSRAICRSPARVKRRDTARACARASW